MTRDRRLLPMSREDSDFWQLRRERAGGPTVVRPRVEGNLIINCPVSGVLLTDMASVEDPSRTPQPPIPPHQRGSAGGGSDRGKGE